MVEINFKSISERDEVHQWIQEGARNIDEDNDVLRTLFFLENGESRTDGLGWTKLNDPLSETAIFNTTEEEFEERVQILENADIDDLSVEEDSEYKEQNEKIIDLLHKIAETLRENKVE